METLLDIVGSLLRSPGVKSEYLSDPAGFLGRHGFDDLDPDDISEALVHVADASPPLVALHLDPSGGLDAAAGLDLDDLDNPFDDAFPGLEPPGDAGFADLGTEVDFDRRSDDDPTDDDDETVDELPIVAPPADDESDTKSLDDLHSPLRQAVERFDEADVETDPADADDLDETDGGLSTPVPIFLDDDPFLDDSPYDSPGFGGESEGELAELDVTDGDDILDDVTQNFGDIFDG